MKITFEGEFTDLNTYINAERGNRYAGAGIKKAETLRVKIESFVTFESLPRVPHTFTFDWYCKDKKKDPDNLSFSQKFILDGLKESGVIQTDGWAVVGELRHRFFVDAANPRVEVEIVAIEIAS